MQINAWDYGGPWEQSSLRAERNTGHLRAVLSPHARAPIINNSCPCYVNPALESTRPQNSTHSGAATCRPADCTAVSFRDQQVRFRLTVDEQRVAQAPVPAHCLVAHAHGKDAGVLELHVADDQVVIRYLVTSGIFLNENSILVPEGMRNENWLGL